MSTYLLPVLLVNFMGTVGFSVVIPFLVFVVRDFGGNGFVYGLVGAVYPAMQLVGAPILGRWSDRVGRRRALLVSQVGTLLAWLLFTSSLLMPRLSFGTWDGAVGRIEVTLPLLVVFFSRALDGLTGGNIVVANAYVGDVSTDADRSRNFGRMGISANLGFVLGPGLASVFGALGFGFLAPALTCVAISVLGTGLILFILPDSVPEPPCRDRAQPSIRRVFGQGHRPCEGRKPAWREALERPGLKRLLAVYFLIFLGFNFFYTAFPVHAAEGLGWKVTRTGSFFMLLSGLMVLVQGPVLQAASARASSETLVVTGMLLLSLFFVVLTANSTALTFTGTALFALGNGLMWPSVLAMISERAGAEAQGAVQGVAGSLASLASVFGLVAGGVLYQALGEGTFLISSWVMLSGVLLMAMSSPGRGERRRSPRGAREEAATTAASVSSSTAASGAEFLRRPVVQTL
ncbi:MAG: MFS transporter [Myxococcota bacterium]